MANNGGIKSSPESKNVQTRPGAAAAVKQIAHLTALLGMAVAARDAELLAVQAKHENLILNLTTDIDARKAGLEAWAEANRKAEFGGAQSIEFTNGWVRYRMGNERLEFYAGWDEKKTLEKVLSFGVTSQWDQYIKRKPKLDLQKILRDAKGPADPGLAPLLTKARLRVIGLRVDQEERFDVEAKPEMAVAEAPMS